MIKPAPILRIGIGGWTYAPWRGVFYPEGLAHRDVTPVFSSIWS